MNSGFLKIIHQFAYEADDPYEKKQNVVKETMEELKKLGYDGVVTNVSFTRYLEDEDEWKLMEQKAQLCKQLGMRLWIYDEKGYPSGGAGGLTVNENPEFETRGAVVVTEVLKPGETRKFSLPRGHIRPIAAFGYPIEGESASQGELSAEPVRPVWQDGFTFENTTNANLLCMCFFEKHVYEGAHCQHNCHASRRYLDIGSPEAVQAFINNTYKKYVDCLEPYFREGVAEAFFTDEPSYMGTYINAGLYPPKVDHAFDDTLPLYPVVNWTKDFDKVFQERYGYRIEDYMPMIFSGNDEKSSKVRKDFYMLLSKRAETSYLGGLSSYCEEHGAKFSGHLLLEDSMLYHVAFEGNFFDMLRHMHIPGTDMLESVPEHVWDMAFAPILVHSVSSLYRDGHVMDEVSAHMQGGKVSDAEIFASVLLQYCFGADIFTSYYGQLVEENREAAGNIVQAVQRVMAKTKARDDGNILLYYPIETVMEARKPHIDGLEAEDTVSVKAQLCEQSMMEAMYALLNRQLPFLYTDLHAMQQAKQRDPKVLILPACQIDDELERQLKEFDQAGCRILVLEEKEHRFQVPESLRAYAEVLQGSAGLEKWLDASGMARTSGDTERVGVLWSEQQVLLVNSTQEDKALTVDVTATQAVDCRNCTPVEMSTEGGKTSLVLKPYQVVLIGKRGRL